MFSKDELTNIRTWEHFGAFGDAEQIERLSLQLLDAVSSDEVPVDFVDTLMSHKEDAIRECGVWLASELRADRAESLLPRCVKLLGDPVWRVRFHAATSILMFGEMGFRAAFTRLLRLLSDAHSSVRFLAAKILVSASDRVFDDHVSRVDETREEDGEFSEVVVNCLQLAVSQGRGFPELLQDYLRSGDQAVRIAAVVAAVRIGKAALPVIEAACLHQKVDVRDIAAPLAYTVGPTTVPCLVSLLQNESSSSVRAGALESLSKLPASTVIEHRKLVFRQLNDQVGTSCCFALMIVERLAPFSSSELACVMHCLGRTEQSARFMAGQILANVARSEARGTLDHLVPEMTRFLESGAFDDEVRCDLLYSLGACSAEILNSLVNGSESLFAQLLAETNEHIVLRTLYILAQCSQVSPGILAKVRKLVGDGGGTEDVWKMGERIISKFGYG